MDYLADPVSVNVELACFLSFFFGTNVIYHFSFLLGHCEPLAAHFHRQLSSKTYLVMKDHYRRQRMQ